MYTGFSAILVVLIAIAGGGLGLVINKRIRLFKQRLIDNHYENKLTKAKEGSRAGPPATCRNPSKTAAMPKGRDLV